MPTTAAMPPNRGTLMSDLKRPLRGRWKWLALAALCLLFAQATLAQQIVKSVAQFSFVPTDVATDASGNVYVLDSNGGKVIRIAPNGTRTTVAGGGSSYWGDNGPATQAALGGPTAIAVAGDGTLYIAEFVTQRVRAVGSDGIIRPFAGVIGCDICGIYGGDGGPAVNASIGFVGDIAVGPTGDLFIADRDAGRIRRVTNGIINTVAGNGSYADTGDGGPALNAGLYLPRALAVGADGSMYIGNFYGTLVRRVGPDGIINRLAGDGIAGSTGDGGPALLAHLQSAYGLGADGANNVYLTNYAGSYTNVRRVDAAGIISRATGGTANPFSEGMPALDAPINSVTAVYASTSGTVYVADYNTKTVYRVYTPAPPARPAAPDALAGNGEALVTFSEAVGDGPILYSVESDPAAGTDANDATASLVHRVTGLANGTPYRFRVIASNLVGDSPASDWSNEVTPKPVAAAPTQLVATAGSVGTVNLVFQPSSDAAALGVTGYHVVSYPAGAVDAADGTTATSRTLTGLQFGTSYVFTASAINSQGLGLPSEPSNALILHSPPSPPTIYVGSFGQTEVRIDFGEMPDSGDTPITGYTLSVSPADWTDPYAGTLYPNRYVSGLQPGVTYTITATASNANLTSAPSAPVIVTVGYPPSPPDIINVDVGSGAATVSFGGSSASPAVTGYRMQVESINGEILQTADLPPDQFSFTASIPNGQTARFAVVAINALGESAPAYSNYFTPRGVGASISDAQVVEGNNGTRDMVFTLTLDHTMPVPVNLYVYTTDGSAIAGDDYQMTNKTVTIAAGKTFGKVVVPILGDMLAEANETLLLWLNPNSEALVLREIGLGTIINDDCVNGKSRCNP